jgi:hypothetical protein
VILGGVTYLVGAAVSCGTGNVFMAILDRARLDIGLGFANQVYDVELILFILLIIFWSQVPKAHVGTLKENLVKSFYMI